MVNAMVTDNQASVKKTVRTRDRVFRAVKDRLISGAHLPGEKIKIRPLASALGTSTTPVREALLQLVVAGALKHDPQQSVRVPILSAAEYSEIIKLRILLEGEIAFYAAENIELDEIAELERLSLNLLNLDDSQLEDYKANIVKWHFTLYNAAKMYQAIPLIEMLWLQTGPYLNLYKEKEDIAWGQKLRGKMLQGLRDGNGELVRQIIKDDLNYVQQQVVKTFK